MRSYFLVLLVALTLWPSLTRAAETTSGIDTLGADQIFAVQGQQVGDWNRNQLSVTGNVVSSGNVQVTGSVQSGGIVQVGQTTANCTTALQGALRYIAGSPGHMVYCNGSAWQAFAPMVVTVTASACGGHKCNTNALTATELCVVAGYSQEIDYSPGNGNGDIWEWTGSAWGVADSSCSSCNAIAQVTCE